MRVGVDVDVEVGVDVGVDVDVGVEVDVEIGVEVRGEMSMAFMRVTLSTPDVTLMSGLFSPACAR